jgi:hypothetical protein
MIRFFQNESSFKLPVSSFTQKQTESKARRVAGGALPGEAGSALAILECFSEAHLEVEAALKGCLAVQHQELCWFQMENAEKLRDLRGRALATI